jgi:hypothetical protein
VKCSGAIDLDPTVDRGGEKGSHRRLGFRRARGQGWTPVMFLRPLAMTEVRTRCGETGRGRIRGLYSRFRTGATQRGGWRGAAYKGASGACEVADLLRDKTKKGVRWVRTGILGR